MKKNLTELVFILDRSGSMYNLVNDTIGGFNSMIESQKKESGEAYVTTVLFDDHYELLHDHINLKEIQRHFGITFIVISHDLRIILQLCQEIILLQKGEIIFQTTQDPDIFTIQSLQASVETDHLDRIEGNVIALVACLRTGPFHSLLDIVRRQHAE